MQHNDSTHPRGVLPPDGPKPRISESPLDLAHAGPAIFAALAKAQGEVRTIGKDGDNRDARYRYATAENVVRHARGPLSSNGISVFRTWTFGETEAEGDVGNRFLAGRVTIHWVLAHESGEYIRGTAEVESIGSRRTPHDKAMAAALTYAWGFVLLGLLNMDRDEEGAAAVDRRDDEREAPVVRRRAPARSSSAPPPDQKATAKRRLWGHWKAWAESNGADVSADFAGMVGQALGQRGEVDPGSLGISELHKAADFFKAANEAEPDPLPGTSSAEPPAPYDAPGVSETEDGTLFDEETGEVYGRASSEDSGSTTPISDLFGNAHPRAGGSS